MSKMFISLLVIGSLVFSVAAPVHAQSEPTTLTGQSGSLRLDAPSSGPASTAPPAVAPAGQDADRELPTSLAPESLDLPSLPQRPAPLLTGPGGFSADVTEFVNYFQQRAVISQDAAEARFSTDEFASGFYGEWELARQLASVPLTDTEPVFELPGAGELPSFDRTESLGLFATPTRDDITTTFGAAQRQFDDSVDLNRPWQRLRPVTVDRDRVAAAAQSGPSDIASLLASARGIVGAATGDQSTLRNVREGVGFSSAGSVDRALVGSRGCAGAIGSTINNQNQRIIMSNVRGLPSCNLSLYASDPTGPAGATGAPASPWFLPGGSTGASGAVGPASSRTTPQQNECLERSGDSGGTCTLRENTTTGEREECVRRNVYGCQSYGPASPFTDGDSAAVSDDFLVAAVERAIDGDAGPLVAVSFNVTALDVGERAELFTAAAMDRYPGVGPDTAALLFGQDLSAAHFAVAADTTNPTHHMAATNVLNFTSITLSTIAN